MLSSLDTSLRIFGDYYRSHGGKLFDRLALPCPASSSVWPDCLRSRNYQNVWQNWGKNNRSGGQRHKKAASLHSATSPVFPWDDAKLVERILVSLQRENASQVVRLGWLSLVRYPLVPKCLVATLLQDKLAILNRPGFIKQQNALVQLLPACTLPPADRRGGASIFYYVPENLTQLAHRMTLAPLSQTHAFPKHYQETDGLDAFLQLALLWQLTADAPIRVKLCGSVYKKDGQRLHEALGQLKCPIPNSFVPTAVWVHVARILGLLRFHAVSRELQASQKLSWPTSSWWHASLEVWNAWLLSNLLDIYDPAHDLADASDEGRTYAALQLYIALHAASVLSRLPKDTGITLQELAHLNQANAVYSVKHLPEKVQSFAETWLHTALAMMWALGLVLWNEEKKALRLSSLGRALFGLDPDWPGPDYEKNLLVMPNLEIVAYRQALTPQDIATLSHIARWKAVFPVAVLQMDTASLHRAWHAGWSPSDIMEWLQRHSTRELPDTIKHLIATSAEQQQRLILYRRATLMEFECAHDLEEALERGTPGKRLGERFLLVEDSSPLDYSHFRVTANLDYTKPATSVVRVLSDGITLEVKWNQANLLVESELQQLAERVHTDLIHQVTRYRMTAASLSRARRLGWTALRLHEWFLTRCGVSVPDAVTALFTLSSVELQLQQVCILETGSEALAHGISQWPETSPYIIRRIGPTTLVVHGDKVSKLLEVLTNLGGKVKVEEPILPNAEPPSASS